jgi:hypothetical protein
MVPRRTTTLRCTHADEPDPEAGTLVSVTVSATRPRTRQCARRVAEANHASRRVAFCRSHDHASALVNRSNHGARVGGSTFLEVDPIEGGSANDYDYANADSVNNFDLSGEYCVTGVARTEHWKTYDKKHKKYVDHSRQICRSVSRGSGRVARATGRGLAAAGRGANRFLSRCWRGVNKLGPGNAGFGMAEGGFHAAEAYAIVAGEHALEAAASIGGGAVFGVWFATACAIG